MATVTSKVADRAHGAVFVVANDKNGIPRNHTIYVCGLNGQTVDDAITAFCTAIDAEADAINAAFSQAGL